MNKQPIEKAARIIADIFVPPVPALSIFIIYSLRFENGISAYLSIFVAFAFTFAAPILYFIHLRNLKIVSDNDATNRHERGKPYLVGAFYTLLGLSISLVIDFNFLISAIWTAYLVNMLVIFIINRYWKISAHAMGVSGPAAALFFVDPFVGGASLFVVLVVGIARVVLKVHTIAQVIMGAILGWILMYTNLLLFENYFG